MDALFGTEMPLLRFVVAFVIVLGLIGAAAYLIRRFGANGLAASAIRGRQPRLAVIDSAAVDSRRRLILVRRDNVEHLVLIGGPSDLVVESNIVRATAAAPQRETQPPRPAAADNLPRPVPLPEAVTWPPEPLTPRQQPARPAPAHASPVAEEGVAWPPPLQPTPRPPVEPPSRTAEAERIAGLAADLSRAAASEVPRRPEPPRRAPPPPPVAAPTPLPQGDDDTIPNMAQMLETALRSRNKPEPAAAPPMRPAPEPMRPEPVARPVEPPVRARPPADAAPAPMPAAAEPKPLRAAPAVILGPGVPPAAPTAAPSPIPPAPPPAPPAAPAKPAYDSLEQEMASLLGRPTGKT